MLYFTKVGDLYQELCYSWGYISGTSLKLGVNFAVLHSSWGYILGYLAKVGDHFSVLRYNWGYMYIRYFDKFGGQFCCTSLQLGIYIRYFATVGGQFCCTSLQLETYIRYLLRYSWGSTLLYFTTLGDIISGTSLKVGVNFAVLHFIWRYKSGTSINKGGGKFSCDYYSRGQFCCNLLQLGVNYAVLHNSWVKILLHFTTVGVRYPELRYDGQMSGTLLQLGVNFAVLHYSWEFISGLMKVGVNLALPHYRWASILLYITTVLGQLCCTSLQLGVNFTILHYSWWSILLYFYSWG